MVRDVSQRDLAVTVLGTEPPAPVALAPVGVQTIVHPEGELAVARAAAAVGLAMALRVSLIWMFVGAGGSCRTASVI